jgi:hypothetical protein
MSSFEEARFDPWSNFSGQKVGNYRLAKVIFNSKVISNLIKLIFSLPGPFPTNYLSCKSSLFCGIG